jgi:hypothetical protein
MILPNGEELSPLIEPVVVTQDYYIGIEDVAGFTFLHARMFGRWTSQMAREFRAVLDSVCAARVGPFFAASHQPHNGDHAKFAKFVRLMGFKFNHTVRGTDGFRHSVYVRWR